MEYAAGNLVRSLAGHDTGKLYVILSEKEDRLLLADGKRRTVGHPKEKKKKHVQVIHTCDERTAGRIAAGTVQDADLVYAIHCVKGE